MSYTTRKDTVRLGRTNDYASPEVLFSKFCWPISDYYSLGITIYELLTGHTPYYNERLHNKHIRDCNQIREKHLLLLSTYLELLKI